MKVIKKLGGVSYVKDYEELKKNINKYLINKNFKLNGRRRILIHKSTFV